METIKRIGILLVTLAFVVGCGESFRAQELSSSNQNTNDLFIQVGADVGGEASPQVQALKNNIRAFDNNVTANSSTGSYDIAARITFSCQSRLDFAKTVSSSELLSRQEINLGVQQSHIVKVQCINADCSRVLASISTDGTMEGTLFVGMAVNSQVENTLVYLSQNVSSYPNFATFQSGSYYHSINSCPAPQEETSIMDQIVDVIQEEATEFIVKEAEDLLKGWLGL